MTRRTVAIVQARMASSRLPGKVLMDLGGETMVACVLRRASNASMLDEVVLATSVLPVDDVLAEHARSLGVPVFRGQEEDVLDRYFRAAQAYQADVVVRITADCPFIDATVIDRVVGALLDSPDADFASNTLRRTFPCGLDVEVATYETLATAWREAREFYQRSHVFPYVYEHGERFRLINVEDADDNSWMRWTVDTEADLEFVRQVYARLEHDHAVSWLTVLALVKREPSLLEINRHVPQKALREG